MRNATRCHTPEHTERSTKGENEMAMDPTQLQNPVDCGRSLLSPSPSTAATVWGSQLRNGWLVRDSRWPGVDGADGVKALSESTRRNCPCTCPSMVMPWRYPPSPSPSKSSKAAADAIGLAGPGTYATE